MVLYIVIALLIWGALGYGVSYARYGNTKIIDELRAKFHALQAEFHEKEQLFENYKEENTLLKQKAQELLNQNEDFSKMVSELTRYYYRIKQAAEKVKEMSDIVGVYDEAVEHKLDRMITDDSTFDGAEYHNKEEQNITQHRGWEQGKKYF